MSKKSFALNSAKIAILIALCVYILVPELIYRRPSLFVVLVLAGMVVGGISTWQAAKEIFSKGPGKQSKSDTQE